MSITSYAQNFEDVMLWRALGHVPNGFYIDVGAQHPVIDSVSKAFYEHGWRGVHVEATSVYATMVRADRPDEIVLQVALGDKPGSLTFYEIPDTGLSTGDASIAEHHRLQGFNVVETVVPCMTLAEVFRQFAQPDIHWLKIDVEGMEAQVLAGWGDCPVRPWILVIESTYPNSQIEMHQTWESAVLDRGYINTYFDGLSRYYVLANRSDLAQKFNAPPNIFDGFSLAHTVPYNGPTRGLILQKEKSYQATLAGERTNAADELQSVHETLAQRKDALDAQISQIQHQASIVSEQQTAALAALSTEATRQVETLRRQHKEREQYLYKQLQTTKEEHLREQTNREKAHNQQLLIQQENFYHLQLQQSKNEQTLLEEHNHSLQEQEERIHVVLHRERQLIEQLQNYQHKAAQEKAELLHKQSEQEQILHRQSSEYEAALAQQSHKLEQLLQRQKEDQEKLAQALNSQIAALQNETHTLQQAQQLQAQQHAIELQNELGKHIRGLEIRTALETQLQAEMQSRQQANLHLQQLLEEIKQSIETTQASLRWCITTPLHKLAALITPNKNQVLAASSDKEPVTADRSIQTSHEIQSATIDQILFEPTTPTLVHATFMNIPTTVSTLEQLLALNGRQFVDYAYTTLLGRTADPEGQRYYLSRLSCGYSKMQIVAQLHLSQEGKKCGNYLSGLEPAIQNYKRAQHALVGWLFRRIDSTEGNSAAERKLRAIENKVFLLMDESKQRFDDLDQQLADVKNLVTQQTSLISTLDEYKTQAFEALEILLIETNKLIDHQRANFSPTTQKLESEISAQNNNQCFIKTDSTQPQSLQITNGKISYHTIEDLVKISFLKEKTAASGKTASQSQTLTIEDLIKISSIIPS